MIKYALKCEKGHAFESWFASAEAYNALRKSGHVSCVTCGSTNISKALMAPNVSVARGKGDAADKPREPDPAALLEKMRAEVEANATYVGGSFAKEARAQPLGNMPDRPIYGEANREEAKSLIEDGVPVAPLPFIPKRKAN